MIRPLFAWFTSILLNAIALMLVAELFVSFYLQDFGKALIASIILSILTFIVRPILIFLTLPITIMTIGIYIIVINAITMMITQKVMDDDFISDGVGIAFL